MPDFKAESKDVYGLPKISIDGGKPETSDRAATRAPILIGGTITGKQFQTDAVDPRITIDSTSLICHNTAGQATVTINIANGNVDLLAGAGVNATLRVIDSSGTVLGTLGANATIGGIVLQGIGQRTIVAYMTTADNFGSYPNARVDLFSNFAGLVFNQSATQSATISLGSAGTANYDLTVTDGTRTVQMNMNPALASTNFIRVGEATARLRIGSGASAGTNPVDYINGNLVFQTGNKWTCNIAGQSYVVGIRAKAVAAADVWGAVTEYRHVRTDTAGAAVTPGSITLGTPHSNTNVSSNSMALLRADSALARVAATAAGVVEYANVCTVN